MIRTTILLFVVLPIGGCTLPSYDLQSGLRRAQRANKLLLVTFTRVGCPYTARMDREAFVNAEVREHLRDFVPVRLDAAMHREEVDRLGVTVSPTFVVYRSTGTFVSRHDGIMSADQFRRFLIRARINR